MTKTQETLLRKIEKELQDKKERIIKDNLSENCNYWWVVLARKNQVEVRADTRTLKALEREGYIKIIEHKECSYSLDFDTVEVL